MKTIQIQASQIQGKDVYQFSVTTDDVIERAIFVEITEDDVRELNEMLNC